MASASLATKPKPTSCDLSAARRPGTTWSNSFAWDWFACTSCCPMHLHRSTLEMQSIWISFFRLGGSAHQGDNDRVLGRRRFREVGRHEASLPCIKVHHEEAGGLTVPGVQRLLPIAHDDAKPQQRAQVATERHGALEGGVNQVVSHAGVPPMAPVLGAFRPVIHSRNARRRLAPALRDDQVEVAIGCPAADDLHLRRGARTGAVLTNLVLVAAKLRTLDCKEGSVFLQLPCKVTGTEA